MLPKKYKSEIISIENPLQGIYTLEFRSLNRPYKYHPGQFLHLAIDSDYDGIGQWPESRCFSMQSNPTEEIVRITYAVKGRFTGEMEKQLKQGSSVWIKLPYGNLFDNLQYKENAVFIAGGTGITPFLSLFTSKDFNQFGSPKIYLGFKSRAYNIYNDELNLLCNQSASIKYFYQDDNGIIDIQEIFGENGIHSVYYISGPPAMIKLFKTFLIEKGVPDVQVITDDWE